jgi:restriction endonuclease S subunit
MAVWSEIEASKAFSTNRLDAEFFQPRYVEIEKRLSNAGAVRLEQFLTDIRYGLNVPPDYVDEGLPFIRALNLKEYGIEGEILNIPYTVEDVGEINILADGDLLIVRSGANVGDVGVVTEDLRGGSFGSYVIRLRVKNINPYYLYVFLKCIFGREQTVRFRSGAAQPNISIPNLKELMIFAPLDEQQTEIENLFFLSYHAKQRANEIYTEAENLLLHELGLDTLDLSHELTYERNFSEVAAAGRYDAQFFQPKYQKVIDTLSERWTVEAIGTWGKALKGRSVGEYIEKGIPVVRSGDLTDIDNVESFKHASPAEDLFYLKRGDVCISSIGFGSIGKVQVFDKEDQPYATVSEVTVVRQNRVNPYYLQIFLQSLAGQLQIERWITGATGQLHLYPRDVEKFIIPVLPEAQQLRFEKIANKARQVRQEAKQLLEDAKRRVEQMILGEEASHVA